MNTHKTISKQREKILLGGVAATALGLINAKPQMVKAANQNGTRATKKATKRTVKTILNYQTETSSETEGATATDDDPTDQSSDNQTNVNISNSNSASLQTQGYTVPTINTENNSSLDYNSKTNTNQFDSTKATRDSSNTISSTWEDIPVTFNNGVLSIGEEGKSYTINNSDDKNISIGSNIDNVSGDDITEIDINAPIAIIGSAQMLFFRLTNLNTINGLDKLDTSKVTSMLRMFFDCKKIVSLDLSSFDTTNVTSFNIMFSNDPNLTSVDLSSFTVSDDATTVGMFSLIKGYTSSLTKLILGKGFKFTTSNGRPNNSLQQPGTWVNMGAGEGSPAKGTNIWTSDELMTNYQGDRDHDTYVRYTGGTVTVHRQDEDGKQLVDQDGKQIPDEKLFGNISDPVTVDTSKEFAGYTFKENQNSDVKAFTSDPQDITLVYSKSKTDNTSDNTWEGVPYTFNNGVLSLGEKGKTYAIDNSGNKEKSYALDTRDISLSQNIKGVNIDEIKEIDLNANIAITGSANGVFKNLKDLATINGLGNLDTSQVTNMEEMFSNCPKLTALDLSSLNTNNVASYSSMFSGDTALISVDLSSFKVAANAEMTDMFSSCSSLTKLTLGKDFKFTTPDNQPNNSLQQPGTWVNMGAGEGSPAKGTKKWTSAELMTKYQGSTDHDVYVRFTNLGGIVTVHRQDEQGNQIVPDEELFGNISDPINVDTNIAGYTFKENKNPTVTTFISGPQDITLVYTKTPPEQNKAEQVTVHYKYIADNGELVEIPGSDPENFPKDATQSVVGNTVHIPFKSIDSYTPDSYQINNGNIIKSTNVPDVTLTANPQSVTLIYTKTTTTTPGSTPGNNNPNSSGNNGSVNNPSSSNSQGSNSQGSNTGNSNNNSSSASNGQNNGNNLPNNEPNNIPTPVNRKPKTVRPHKTINKGFNIKDQNAIHNQQLANSLKNNGSSSNAQNSVSNTLPQTGNDKHNSLAMLALGSLALATALGAAWFGRKKD